MSGRFITLEGIDGAGKSTHFEALAERLARSGAVVIETREPGGTPLAEQLRELLLTTPIDAVSEALLVYAARRDHVERVIAPALARGDTVLCDRFNDATFAYQGGGKGADPAFLRALDAEVVGGLEPDLTLWLDLPAELAAARRGPARRADRFEAEGVAFFERVRAAYALRCAEAPHRFVRIDASADRASVAHEIDAALAARGW